MKHTALYVLAMTVGLTMVACGDDKTPAGADATSDSSVETDTTTNDVGPDTAPDVTTADVPADTAVADVPADTVVPQDLGEDTAPDDTTLADVTDTVGVDVDADTSLDTVEPPTDVATDTGPDVIEPARENVFVNGGFESWVDNLPVGWFGFESNIIADNVVEDLMSPKEGLRACQLVNSSSTHKRFSSAGQPFQAGRYTCTYWVRGTGEIRNARYNGTTDTISTYSSYTSIADGAWRQLTYEFNVPSDVPSFELVFSVKNTSNQHIRLDDVICSRAPEPCDALTCEDWQVCNPTLVACEAAPGLCDDGDDCAAWEVCDEAHTCVLAPDSCLSTADCGGETPVCDLGTHLCVAGDPCAGVVCDEWKQCDPTDSGCDVSTGRCAGLVDCSGETPVCDVATHTCVAIDDPKNVVPNGSFESWSTYTFGTTGYLLPDYWYGLNEPGGLNFPETEIPAASVRYYTTAAQGGTAACQLVDTGAPADRFTTEPFSVVAGATYDCAYWVRGHGNVRHSHYCGQQASATQFVAYDSDAWQQVRFAINGNASKCVLIFYASNTVADRDHIQLDDVVCIRR